MTRLIIAGLLAISSITCAHAANNPQRMVGGGIFPTFVNSTGTSQSNAKGAYVNQTQYVPGATKHNLGLMGVGK